MTEHAPQLPPIGSRWYIAGSHFEVIGHGQRDGEPAILAQSVRNPKAPTFRFIWRLTCRRALPSGA